MSSRLPILLVIIALLGVATIYAIPFDSATGITSATKSCSNEELVDQLIKIDAPAPGLHPTAMVIGFIGNNEPLEFGGGVMGSTKPSVPPAMKELIKRGVSALPVLIAHLGDKRPTGWVIETGFGPQKEGHTTDSPRGFHLVAGWFSDEYDPKVRSMERASRSGKELGNLPDSYTV